MGRGVELCCIHQFGIALIVEEYMLQPEAAL